MDPILSLAVTVHSSKGCYAVLLGSGVSRSAGIPTGWEVILDLSRRLAKLLNEDCEPDPAAWFKARFGTAPDYGDLLNKLAKSPTERSQLLRPYFEPTPEERNERIKISTAAHRAIASLVEQGFIKVIITTNFDKLMESALEELGVTPQVIASPDAAIGALPIAHSRCTVLKVHGDYLDSRIKNSPAELSKYHKNFNVLLDRIFDEYGLIVCGWSAEWDLALRAAVERCKGRRFSTYWMARGEPSDHAKTLIDLRGAVVIRTKGADEFFADLAEKVASLDESARPHPLSAKVAVATLKRYVVDEEARIRLADLMREETERAYSRTCNPDFLKQHYPNDPAGAKQKFDFYNGALAISLGLMIHGCHWGERQHVNLWKRCLERFTGVGGEVIPFVAGPDLRLYPAALLLYGGGIAALTAAKYETVAALLKETQARELNDVSLPAAMSIVYEDKLDDATRRLSGMEKRHTPLSDYLCIQLRDPFREIESDDYAYELAFDRFEVLLALLVAEMNAKSSSTQPHVAQVRPTVDFSMPIWIGRFAWRRRRFSDMLGQMKKEQKSMGEDWPPFRAGMFSDDPQRVGALMSALETRVGQLGWT